MDEIINLKSDAFSITEADSDVPSFKTRPKGLLDPEGRVILS